MVVKIEPVIKIDTEKAKKGFLASFEKRQKIVKKYRYSINEINDDGEEELI